MTTHSALLRSSKPPASRTKTSASWPIRAIPPLLWPTPRVRPSRRTQTHRPTRGTGAGTGASVGTLLGGGAGLLAGIGALAIPGVGPVVAAGWLIATLTGAGVGAAAGGLLGSLTGAGVPEEHAHVYAEGVRRGSTLVTVRAEEATAAQAEAIMQRYAPVDLAERSAAYREGGAWDRFDENRGSLTPEEMEAERLRVINRPGI